MIQFEFQDRQERYEQRLVKQILAAHGVPQQNIGYHAKQLGEEFNLRWFNDSYQDCPVAIESRKLKKPIDFGAIFTEKYHKSEWWLCFEEATNNWPDRDGIAVVFDYYGDNIADLVVHNRPHLETDCVDLVLRGPNTTITSWAQFLKRLCQTWRYSE
jgi:hypothetical protein